MEIALLSVRTVKKKIRLHSIGLISSRFERSMKAPLPDMAEIYRKKKKCCIFSHVPHSSRQILVNGRDVPFNNLVPRAFLFEIGRGGKREKGTRLPFSRLLLSSQRTNLLLLVRPEEVKNTTKNL